MKIQCLMMVAPQITDYEMVIWDGVGPTANTFGKRKLDPYLMPIHLKTFSESHESRDVSYENRGFWKDGRNSGSFWTSQSPYIKQLLNLKTQKLETIYSKTSWAGVLQTPKYKQSKVIHGQQTIHSRCLQRKQGSNGASDGPENNRNPTNQQVTPESTWASGGAAARRGSLCYSHSRWPPSARGRRRRGRRSMRHAGSSSSLGSSQAEPLTEKRHRVEWSGG